MNFNLLFFTFLVPIGWDLIYSLLNVLIGRERWFILNKALSWLLPHVVGLELRCGLGCNVILMSFL